MKKLKKLFLIVLILLVIVVGCTNTAEESVIKENDLKEGTIETPAKEAVKVEEVSTRKIRLKISDPFLEKLPPNPRAEDIGLYIRDNIAKESKNEADKMLEYLLIYQNENKTAYNEKIETSEYTNALNIDMGGVVAKSKLNNIKDEDIRNYFISLINSFLTIEYYYEYDVVETNWNDLMDYSSYLSDDFRKIIELNKKVSNYEYDRYELDVSGLSKDIITLEEIIEKSNSTFVKWMAHDLYRFLILNISAAPENSYIYLYQDKTSKEYKDLIGLKTKYPDSLLVEIIEEISQLEGEDTDEAIEIILKKLQFGLTSDNYFEVITKRDQGGEYDLIEMGIPSNSEKQKKINSIIKLDTQHFIENASKDKKFIFDIIPEYQTDRYISYRGILNTIDLNGNDEYTVIYRTLDYKEERYISLEDYFDADFVFIQDFIEKISGQKLDTLPDFQLIRSGLELIIDNGMDNEEYIYLAHKDLLQYFKLEELIGSY
ncbi:MAG: hypothetical protein GX947_07020 [Tissierellia bacterium]|nr:hypothetical protein [Tissierellia bacterium]